MDTIDIRDLTLRTFVGIYPEEKAKQQEVVINITLFADLSRACESDDIADTVDYKTVKQSVISAVEAGRFNLVEHLAGTVARLCLEAERVQRVRVTVDKPGALRFARSAAVTLEREKHG